jgi:hypothetical protein
MRSSTSETVVTLVRAFLLGLFALASSGAQAASREDTATPPPGPSPVPMTWLRITTDPPGALIAIDGRPIGVAPGWALLPPGSHRVDSQLGGFFPDARMVELAPVLSQTLAVVLRPTPEEELRRAAALEEAAKERARYAEATSRYQQDLGIWEQTTAPLQERRLRGSWYGGTALGVGSALLLGATILGVAAAEKGGEAHDSYAANQDSTLFAGYRSDIESARTRLLVAAIMAGVGLPLTVTGIILLMRRPEVPEAPKPPSVRLDIGVAPLVGGGSLSAVGRF